MAICKPRFVHISPLHRRSNDRKNTNLRPWLEGKDYSRCLAACFNLCLTIQNSRFFSLFGLLLSQVLPFKNGHVCPYTLDITCSMRSVSENGSKVSDNVINKNLCCHNYVLKTVHKFGPFSQFVLCDLEWSYESDYAHWLHLSGEKLHHHAIRQAPHLFFFYLDLSL